MRRDQATGRFLLPSPFRASAPRLVIPHPLHRLPRRGTATECSSQSLRPPTGYKPACRRAFRHPSTPATWISPTLIPSPTRYAHAALLSGTVAGAPARTHREALARTAWPWLLRCDALHRRRPRSTALRRDRHGQRSLCRVTGRCRTRPASSVLGQPGSPRAPLVRLWLPTQADRYQCHPLYRRFAFQQGST
ncbi:Uncharacterised protein [Mycobacteroides abscessus subsp. abscessus]|nr:Uncharacterised protein [Mycobacteroides abscessus subsp. abscessus]SIF86234.1 Uncharacterised protein [Mycobacteroides abscessus subsp. abscessus]SIM71190.1 Uncharacterised protein [Mycobacteroides abscessus subsp. abscessus]